MFYIISIALREITLPMFIVFPEMEPVIADRRLLYGIPVPARKNIAVRGQQGRIAGVCQKLFNALKSLNEH
jgi:hypothetical protein